MNIVKSIGAGLAGFVVGAVLSFGTDYILEQMGILPHDNLWVSPLIIAFVLLYRCVYNAFGCYIVARLAPAYPMRHALVLGVLGTIGSIVGALVTANMNLGPTWYAWTLAILTLPSAWFGAWLYTRKLSCET